MNMEEYWVSNKNLKLLVFNQNLPMVWPMDFKSKFIIKNETMRMTEKRKNSQYEDTSKK